MPTGDSLTIFAGLASASLACMIGALTAPHGWRSYLLWMLGAVFALATLGWLFPPSQSPFLVGVMAVFGAFVRSGAMVMVGTVAVVALMIGRKGKADTDPNNTRIIEEDVVLPKFAENPNERSKWEADISLSDAARYLTSKAAWRRTKQSMGTRDVQREIQNSLFNGKLTAWAKEHPQDDDRHQVRRDVWGHAEITLENNSAFFPTVQRQGYDIEVSQGEMETAYPAG